MSTTIGKWTFDWRCDWLQLRHPDHWNWLTFNLIECEFEWDRRLGNLEIALNLLGFGVRAVYNYDQQTELRVELRGMLDDMLSGTNVTVPHDKYVAMKEAADKWKELYGDETRTP